MAASRARIRPPGQNQAERDRVALGKLESFMDAVVDGHFKCPTCKSNAEIKDVSPQAVQLAKMRYDKLRPSLSAVEQTNVNPDDGLDDSAILERFRALIEANPDVLQQLMALQPKPQQDETQPTTH